MFLRILRPGADHAPVFFPASSRKQETANPTHQTAAFQIGDDQIRMLIDGQAAAIHRREYVHDFAHVPDHAPFVPLEGRQAQQVAPIEFVPRRYGDVEGEVFTALTGMGQPQ